MYYKTFKKTKIYFSEFKLEKRTSELECYDSFHIYESYPNYDTLIATFCGTDLNDKIILTDIQDIYIIFQSDALHEEVGFDARIEFLKEKR